jgi:acetyl esterase/lipase
MAGLAEDLAARGLAAWNVEYRRVGEPDGGWPNTLLDVAQATDYLRTLAGRYQIDLQRVVPIGHSAGGHLALWLAGRHRLPATSLLHTETPLALTAAISLAGAIDLEHVWQLNLGRGAASDFLGGSPSEQPERYAHASPAALLPLGIPPILVHGTADDNVPLIVSQQYMQKAQQAGDQVKLITLPGADHFALIDAQTPAWSATLQELDAVL